MTRKAILVCVALLIVATSIYLFMSARNPTSQAASVNADPIQRLDRSTLRLSEQALQNIKTTRIEVGEFPKRLYIMGTISVTEDRTTVVSARADGRVENIYFASGEPVAKGQLLASLFSSDFLAAREEFILAQHDANSDITQIARRRLETLGLSQQDIENIKELTLLPVHAPQSGYLITKSVSLGDEVDSGDALFTVGNMDKVWFAGDLYPEDISQIQPNQDVVIIAAGTQTPVYGKISFVSPSVDPATHSIKIRALMDNPNVLLRADMYVQGNITIKNERSLVVPIKAVVQTSSGTVVFRQVAASDFKRVPVTIGDQRDGLASIISGLEAGDQIVNEGALLLDAALNSVGQ